MIIFSATCNTMNPPACGRSYNDNMAEKAEAIRFTIGEIDVDLCFRFMDYLQTTPQIHRNEKKQHTNTAAGYWSTDAKPSAIKLV